MLAQDCEDWKCIFVDGYSTDGSWEYMQQFTSDPRFSIRRGIKQGMYADWNECLRYVDTEYFYFLTSDDTCYPQLVSTTMAVLNKVPDVDVCHFKFDFIDKSGAVINAPSSLSEHCSIYKECNSYIHRRSGISEFIMHFVYRAVYTTITSLVFRRRLIDKLYGFSSQYGAIGDYDWTMRMGLVTDVLFLPETLATWRIYDEQATKCTTPIQSKERLLAVAVQNLEEFLKSEQAIKLKSLIDLKELINDFRDEHAASLYGQLIINKTNAEKVKFIYHILRYYPFYPVKKLLNRLSFNLLFSYPARSELAYQFIQNYKLPWPPQTLSIDEE